MPIIEMPPDGSFEPEHRGFFQPETEAHVGVIGQGSVSTVDLFKGAPHDHAVETYDVRMLVGPLWRDVANVVPKVTIDAFDSNNPDQDDFMKWRIANLTWDTLGEFGPNQNEDRIRLKFQVSVQGEYAQVERLGYFLMASGRMLGEGGLNEPGPVKAQGQP